MGPKKFLGKYNITRYYTPVKGQKHYYYCKGYDFDILTRPDHPNLESNLAKQDDCYNKDFYVNCSGDCFHTADGTDLHSKRPFTVLACPPSLPFGTRIWIDNGDEAVCHDRGGAIKNNKIDLWAGIGDEGLKNIRSISNGGLRKVYIIE